MNFRRQISRKNCVLRIELIIATGDPLVIVFNASQPKQDFSAWIGSLRQLQGNFQGRRAELGKGDAIVYERRTQVNVSTLTGTGREHCKVPLQHRRRGDETRIIRRVLTNLGSLICAEEKQFVLHDRATERAAILVSLQRIPLRGEKVPRIEL